MYGSAVVVLNLVLFVTGFKIPKTTRKLAVVPSTIRAVLGILKPVIGPQKCTTSIRGAVYAALVCTQLYSSTIFSNIFSSSHENQCKIWFTEQQSSTFDNYVLHPKNHPKNVLRNAVHFPTLSRHNVRRIQKELVLNWRNDAVNAFMIMLANGWDVILTCSTNVIHKAFICITEAVSLFQSIRVFPNVYRRCFPDRKSRKYSDSS